MIVEDADLHGVEVEDVAWFAGRFVAVGWAIDPLDGGDVAVIAISEDGVAWERLPATAFPPPGRALGRAVALDDGILVLGSEADADGEASIGAAWVSTDGLRWQQVAASSALPSTLDMGGPVRFGDGLVAVGRGRGPEGETFGPVSWLIR